MSNTQNVKTFNMTGSGDEVIAIENELLRTQITAEGISGGTLTVKAKSNSATVFETVDGGTIDLATVRTILIEGYSIDELQITTSTSTAYTLILVQTELKLF
jgi:hypothetical protein